MLTYLLRFPALLATRRLALHLSVADLAASCEMTPNLIERLEQGCFLPSPSQAYRLAQALRLDPLDLGRRAIAELLIHPEYLAEHVSEACLEAESEVLIPVYL